MFFYAFIHKVKYQGKIELGNDECVFYKEKCHRKSQCHKLLKSNKKNFKSPSSNVVVVATLTTTSVGSNYVYPSKTTSQIFDIVDQLQKTLATHPHAVYVSFIKGLNSSSLSNMYPSTWILIL